MPLEDEDDGEGRARVHQEIQRYSYVHHVPATIYHIDVSVSGHPVARCGLPETHLRT